VDGSGFTASTAVTAAGLGISSVQFVSPSRIDLALASATELTGTHYQVRDQSQQVDFFSALPSASPGNAGTTVLHTILPLTELESVAVFGFPGAFSVAILLNPSNAAADVFLREINSGGAPISGRILTIPGQTIAEIPVSSSSGIFVDVKSPLRIAEFDQHLSIARILPGAAAQSGPPPLHLYAFPTSLSANYQIGSASPAPQSANASYGPGVHDISVAVNAGTWLNVTKISEPGSASLTFAFSPTGLAPGTYVGTVTATPVVPSSLLGFPTEPTIFTMTLYVSPKPAIASPAAAPTMTANPPSLAVLLTSYGTASVPVTVNITTSPLVPPLVSSIVNAASQLPGPLSPGEIITVRGINVGPAPVGVTLDPQGRVASSAQGEQVLINEIPAPILYGSPGQWNVVVPYEVDGMNSATIRIADGAATSKTWILPVAAVSPAIFTIGSTGLGNAAILNQDNTVNSPSNPAPRGTVVQIFATGGGQLVPSGVTGTIGFPAKTNLPVSVSILDSDAAVVYAGPAPGGVSGLIQINAVVPSLSFPSSVIRMTLQVGGVASQPGVSIAVK